MTLPALNISRNQQEISVPFSLVLRQNRQIVLMTFFRDLKMQALLIQILQMTKHYPNLCNQSLLYSGLI